jgi:hypothetical protein
VTTETKIKPALGYYTIGRPWEQVRYYMDLGLGYEDIAHKLKIPASHIRDFVLRGGK